MGMTEVMRKIRNFFPCPNERMEGSFTITDGVFDDLTLTNGRYYLIEGSVFNDGVHQYTLSEDITPIFNPSLTDEVFEGAVTPMAVPKGFIELCDKIAAYDAKVSENAGPYSSESFGGYSYSKMTNKQGGVMTGMEYYAGELNAWRKI